MPGAPREVDHTLPAVERVEHHRKSAKELLRAARAGQVDALSRLRGALGDLPGELRLADAQRAIAREHGHASWASFRRDLERQVDEPVRSVARLGPVDPARFEQAANRLLRTLASGDTRARERLRAHVPRLARLDDSALSSRATIADARLVIAREYGFPTWRKLLAGLREESATPQHAHQGAEPVAAALAAIRGGDADSLRRLLRSHPGVGGRRGGSGRFAARPGRATRRVRDLAETRARRRSGLRGCVDRIGQRAQWSSLTSPPATTASSSFRCCWLPAPKSTPPGFTA